MIEAVPDTGFLSPGQAAAKRAARHATGSGRLGRTLLVHGPAGAGKDAFVGDLLALLFCADPDPERRPCNACRGCRDARSRVHQDLVVGSPEAWREMRSTGESIVAAARRWLLEAAGAPVVADRRVVLIDRADRANEQTQNALLKTLEEPTDRHVFILVADEPARLLPTIRSRSQPLRVGPVARAELVAYLMDHRRLPADQADALARIANGLAGTALAYADNAELLAWRRRVQAELLSLLSRGRADRFASVRDLLDETTRLGVAPPTSAEAEADAPRTPASVQREAAMLLVEAWLDLTRDLLVACAGRAELAPSRELAPAVADLGGRVGAHALIRMVALLERMHDGLRENAAPKLALEAAMLAWPMLPPPAR
ncbi:MAG TPA: hypothetical protein VHQ42_03450 [Candidatus Limnocylindria bacterium]|nr:hypothetical protein [Candidatus Limnocylindria bacterium]